MVSKEQATQTEQLQNQYRKYFGLTGKNVLHFLSSLIVPLMLGVFTVVITFHQQKLAQEQRNEDMQLLREQRLEDKNESRAQRKQEWDIAIKNQEIQNQMAIDRYRDEVLVAYIKEIGELLEKNNGSLTSDSVTRTLARVKTLNVLRQLDGSRQIHVIRFLYEARQLSNTNESDAIDISKTELTNIDFRELTLLMIIEKISLAVIHLQNCTFSSMVLINVNFFFARLENVDFSSAELYSANFSSAKLYGANFSSALLLDVDFSSAKLYGINFSSAKLYGVNFSSAKLKDVDFSSAELTNVNFSSSYELENVNFSSATLIDVNFSSATLIDVNFSSAEFSGCDYTLFFLMRFIFLITVYWPSSFHHAKMAHTIFVKCNCKWADFSYANLSMSVFWHANLWGAIFHNADLTKTNFSLANLLEADLTNTTVTGSQLQGALSIYNAKLPNGTLGRSQNLVKNGDANCNISLADHWQVRNGNIAVVASKENRSECQFSLQSVAIEAIMSQRIDLVGIWDSSIWTHSSVEFQAHMSSGVSIELSGRSSNGTVINKQIASK
jgi:uncharacterized protein YjbI with pentapeptide repeats